MADTQADLRTVAPSGPSHRLVTVDLETGEIVEGVAVVVRPKRRYIDQEYMLVFQTAVTAVSMDRELGTQELRVLLALLGTIGFGNEWKSINQADLGRELGMKPSNVSAAIATLVRKQILTKGARVGRGYTYSLNPHFGWKGGAKNVAAEQRKAPSLKLIRGGAPEERAIAEEMRALGQPPLPLTTDETR
jgi:hypothetical protein